MNQSVSLQIIEQNGRRIAVCHTVKPLLTDAAAAMDWLLSTRVETGCDCIALNRDGAPPAFYQLHTGLAGAILQKMVDYRFSFALYGDFTPYTDDSPALRAFIRESNRGRDIFFVPDAAAAVTRLAAARA